MKNIVIIILAFFLFSCGGKTNSNPNGFKVHRGTNIAHWLSQSARRGVEREKFITANDIKNIADMGFDHIRLPIDEQQMWDIKGNRNDDAFALLTNCIDWCADNNLRVIVDLHILRSHHFNAEIKPLWIVPAEQKKFYNLWRDLSKTLKKYPVDMVAYELMNEAVAKEPEMWNKLIAGAVEAIRETEPRRTIVIGSNKWQQVQTFKDLKVPEDDENIMLSFHFYEPFLLSHYHASWTSQKEYTGPVHYPGVILSKEEFDKLPQEMKNTGKRWIDKKFDKEWIQTQFDMALEKAEELGLPLYCGEFGVVAEAPATDRLNWYRDMISLLDKNEIGYANWNYKSGNFGLINDNDGRNKELIDIVSGK